jgi:hypothetical protein
MKNNRHASALGRIGGKVKSDAKTQAAKRNGKLGGRPKKIKKPTIQKSIGTPN